LKEVENDKNACEVLEDVEGRMGGIQSTTV